MTDENTEIMEVQTQSLGIAMTPEFAGQLALALSKVHPLSLDGTNAFHKYDYPTVAQVRGNAGQALAQAGIGIIPEVIKWGHDQRTTKSGGTSTVTYVQLRLHLFSTKGSVSVNWPGESEDLTDKGTAKAISAGVKSFLIAFLMMPFSEPENDDGQTDTEIHRKRAKTQPDDITAIISEAKALGVTFKVEGDSLRPVNGQKMTKELSKKVGANSARIVEYIKANSVQVPPSPNVEIKDVPEIPYESEPESSKKQPDEPPVETASPKVATGEKKQEQSSTGSTSPTQMSVPLPTKTTPATTSGTKKTTDTQNGKQNTHPRPYAPAQIKERIDKLVNSLYAGKVMSANQNWIRGGLATAMLAVFTDDDEEKRKEKSHRVLRYLCHTDSFKKDKLPGWYVLAMQDLWGVKYGDDKKYSFSVPFATEEIKRIEHEALLQEGGMPPLSPSADFAAECLTANHTEEEVKAWLADKGWDVLNDWDKCKTSVREFVAIARTQGVDLCTDETIGEMVLARGTELWPVA